jgi:hypothetical protein
MNSDVIVTGYWDGELEQLVSRVVDVFGEPAASAAVDQASWRCQMRMRDGAETWSRVTAYRAALKGELRRLLTPQ